MKQMFSDLKLAALHSKLEANKTSIPAAASRQPVHVVYGGAHLFKAHTPQKLGKIALKSLETYAPNFAEFAHASF